MQPLSKPNCELQPIYACKHTKSANHWNNVASLAQLRGATGKRNKIVAKRATGRKKPNKYYTKNHATAKQAQLLLAA